MMDSCTAVESAATCDDEVVGVVTGEATAVDITDAAAAASAVPGGEYWRIEGEVGGEVGGEEEGEKEEKADDVPVIGESNDLAELGEWLSSDMDEQSVSRCFPFRFEEAAYAAYSRTCCRSSLVSRSRMLTIMDGFVCAPVPRFFKERVTEASLSFFPCISISLLMSYVSVDPNTWFVIGHIACRLTVNLIGAEGLSSTILVFSCQINPLPLPTLLVWCSVPKPGLSTVT